MKKIFLLILFCLSLAACGEENESSNLPGFPHDILTKGDGTTSSTNPAPAGARANSDQRSATPTSDPVHNRYGAGQQPATSDKIPKVPGYVCNSEGICISEKRAKALTPNRDALGYFTNIVGRPYDPCKEDGNCQPNDDDQGEDKE
jgi:hypothetical protein